MRLDSILLQLRFEWFAVLLAFVFFSIAYIRKRERGLLFLTMAAFVFLTGRVVGAYGRNSFAERINPYTQFVHPNDLTLVPPSLGASREAIDREFTWIQIGGALEATVAPILVVIAAILLAAKKRPNKSPEPTPTSVTSPAAQEPRQP